MGNQINVPQTRKYRESPIICCGQHLQRNPLQQASPNFMNVEKQSRGRFNKVKLSNEKNDYPFGIEESTLNKTKDETICQKPDNQLQNSNYQNSGDILASESVSKLLRPISQQQGELKRPGLVTFQKSTYGAYNSSNFQKRSMASTLATSSAKNTKENFRFNQNSKDHKQSSIIDTTVKKQAKCQNKNNKSRINGYFVGRGRYAGRAEQFQNNKRIIIFLQENYVKEPKFKFYQTNDNSSLLDNSTIKFAKNKSVPSQQKYFDENTMSNITLNKNLEMLQKPIQLNFQIDAKIILATCLMIVAVVILIIGATVLYSQQNFFVCLIIAIILYVCYLLICYMYNDLLEYLSNVRSFDQFQEDFKKLRETNGQLAYHIHLETPKTVIKQCYLMSKKNKYIFIQQVQNQNKHISIDELNNNQINCIFIKFKTKTAFSSPQCQFNTISYFDEFLEEKKDQIESDFQNKNSLKESKNQSRRSQIQKKKKKNIEKRQQNFKKALKKCDFGYELDLIEGFSSKPQQNFSACYRRKAESGCLILMFVIFTLLGLCLPFLCFFEAGTRRQKQEIMQIQNKYFKQIQNRRMSNFME